ncbi:MAG: hypothetical protein ACRDTR_05120 [Rubrobacter sp.]
MRGSAGGTPLIGKDPRTGGREEGLTFLILLALVALVCVGCGSAGSQQDPGQDRQRPPQSGGSDGGQASTTKLGHPALGSAGAPVVLTEYSDYQ